MKKFPSIEQFRHVVRAERDAAVFESREPAKRLYVGTVKLHGTNAGITLKSNGDLVYQSRNRVLAIGDDNAGFVAEMSKHEHTLRDILTQLVWDNDASDCDEITVFGEWCGQGIQKGVAIAQLPKMFVIFAAAAGERWLGIEGLLRTPHAPVYSILDFPTFSMEIDFSRPELAQNSLVALTEGVEACCPVGKAFGVEGIGEGVVWRPADGDRSSKFWFKVKGEKHSVTKVAKLAAIDVERFRARDDLVQALVTENRLRQGLDHFLNEEKLDLEMCNIGTFLRWIFNDIMKEESDTIEASGFTQKELGKVISDIAKRYFLKAMNAELEMAA